MGLAVVAAVLTAGCLPTTSGGGNLRLGWFAGQPELKPDEVASGSFGERWRADVAGPVDAQPLVHEGTVLAVTEDNDVFGLDETSGVQRWQRQVGAPFVPDGVPCGDLPPGVGVTGTPVIDPASDTAFFVSKTYLAGSSGPGAWWAHAVDMATGADRPGFPLLLEGTAANDPTQSFSATTQLQRPGLLLMDGVVYAGFGGQCDQLDHQGWVIGFTTAGQISTLWTTEAGAPGSTGAGISQSGGGLVSDAPGEIVLSTGSGAIPSTATAGSSGATQLGQAVVRLRVQPDRSLEPVDFFIPADAADLNATGRDLGSGGPVALPSSFGTAEHPRLGLQIGKEGYLYVLDQTELGGYQQGPGGSDAVIQRLGPFGGAWSKPGVWPGDGGYVYVTTASDGSSAAGSSGALQAFQYGLDSAGKPTFSLVGTAPGAFGFGSGSPVISSSTGSGSALVWVIWSPDGSGAGAELRAYDPIPVGGSLNLRWSAPIGRSSAFGVPLISNNRVIIGTGDGTIRSFGTTDPPPLRIGSPLNFSGIDPEIANATGGAGNSPSFWNNSAGRTTSKVSGDRFTAGNGGGLFQGSCAGPVSNCEFDDNGYVFVNKVESVHGALDIQVYDPATVDVGDFCNGGNSSGGGDKLVDINNGNMTTIINQFAGAGITTTPNGQALNLRERWGRISQQPNAAAQTQARRYCNGDWVSGWNTAVGAQNAKTTWIVRAPDNTPLDSLDNPPICSITFDSYSGPVFNRISATTNPRWNTTGPAQPATEKVPFWKHFRQWFTICNVPSPTVGDYIIQVRNNADTANLGSTPRTTATPGLDVGTLTGPGATTPGNLHNRYSIRTGWAGATPQAAPPSSPWSQGLSVYAERAFPIYTNQGNQLTVFHLSRITPEYAGSRIRLNLWDIGDGANVNLQIRPPAGSPNAFSSCAWTRDDVAFPFTPGPGCGVNGLTTGNFNGRLTSATIDIDPGYTCNAADPLACWFLIDITPVSGNPNDTTTWSVDVLPSG